MTPDLDTRPLSFTRWTAPAAALTTVAGALLTAPGAAAQEHVVVEGDTAFDIASAFGVPLDDLLASNGLTRESLLHPGDVLAVPPRGDSAPLSAPAPASAPLTEQIDYTVAAGDTLYAIAERHGVSLETLYAANGLEESSIIYPDEVLRIPVAVEPESTAAAVHAISPGQALSAEQAENAALIIAVGREIGVSDRGIAVALATAMVESWILNLDWGDRDSLGLFQQRPSMGWGTPEQIQDRERSIRVFYGGAGNPNGDATAGLLDIASWEQLSFADAAQAVQISAYPERYGWWEADAFAWIAAYG